MSPVQNLAAYGDRSGGRQPGGPLAGLRVVEIASIGPGPHCAMLLSDLGAEVLRLSRPGGNGWDNLVMDRGRGDLVVDLRTEEGRETCLSALEDADVLIEGLRPGAMERLGLGPEDALRRNPRLVYGRVTGWGQTGPLAKTAGHDINFLAVTGALAAIGEPGAPPPPPLNLLGDFGGGSLFLAFGVMAALWERERSGKGQVVDAAIIDGVASMMAMFTGLIPRGAGTVDRERNLLGGAAPFYRCYACADGRYISVGAIESQFYAQLIAVLGLEDTFADRQMDPDVWPERRDALAEIFLRKSRDEWCAMFQGDDACIAPVLELGEAPQHPQMAERGVYFNQDGAIHCAPAPRFSRTPGAAQSQSSGQEILARWRARPGGGE